MKKSNVVQVSFLAIVAMLLALLGGVTTVAQEPNPPNQADVVAVTITSDEVSWTPQIESGGYTLTISGPGDFYLSQAYQPGDRPVFRIGDQALPAGIYKYEFQFEPLGDLVERNGQDLAPAAAPVRSGSFSILDGSFVLQDATEDVDDDGVHAPEGVLAPDDQVILDDLIVDGSICVGFDCVNGESFGFDTLRLKENNLRIHFQDTSTSASFPTNDWRISINDSANGGADYFAVQDVDGGTNVFVIEASAGSNALYVDDYGRVGLGTSTPAVELEVRDSDTPSVRLHQDSSGGWTPQTWDLAGNESNFFIRDVTNGSQLPFRIQPGADSNALTIKSNGYIGVGTWSPEESFHIVRTGENAKIVLERTDGDKWTIGGGDTLRIKAGDANSAHLDPSGNLTIQGTLTENSNVNFKENFATVNARDVLATVADLPITSWNFKFDGPSLRHMGPMAQDFYQAFGLGTDEEHISPMDTNGVALAAIQGLNEIVEEKDAQIKALQAQNAELEARLTALEHAVGVRPTSTFLTILPWLLSGILLLVIAGALGASLYVARKS